ncbi:Uma2 family endonuclease [Prosthecobacter sp. SYSU 5D2]
MTILDSPENRATVFQISVELFHEFSRRGMFGEDVELLQGLPFKKLPKSPLHETILRRLLRTLRACIPPSYFLTQEGPITCAHSEPEPDIAVIAGDEEDFALSHPTTAELIIEVAINTQQRDRSKAGIYAEAGVKEYWLVEPENKSITLYTQPSGSGYERLLAIVESGHVQSTVFAEFSVEVGEIFA